MERARHAEEEHRDGHCEWTRAGGRRARLTRLRVELLIQVAGLLLFGRQRWRARLRRYYRLLARRRRRGEHTGGRLGERRQIVQFDHVVVRTCTSTLYSVQYSNK